MGLIIKTLFFNMNNNQQKVKAYELRKQDEVTLVQNLNKFRSELVGLRTSKVSSAPQVKLARIRVVRKAIAKVLTVLHEKQRDEAKTAHANKKYTPRDLRAKRSKAARRQMTKHSKSLVTTRQAKRNGNFRQRRYAVVKA